MSKTCAVLSVLLLALGACGTESTPTSVGSVNSPPANLALNDIKVPLGFPIQIPCSRSGLEIIVFTGTQHLQYSQSTRADGSTRVTIMTNGQGATGTGLVTGDSYRLGGMTQETFDLPAGQPWPASYQYDNNFEVTSAGATGNIVAHETLRVVWDDAGVPTIQVVNFIGECK